MLTGSVQLTPTQKQKQHSRPKPGHTHSFCFQLGVIQKNHIGRKPTEPQTPTAMDPEDVATNTLITISTVGKRTPPNTPLLGKSLDKSRSDAGGAGARLALAVIQASAPNPPLQPRS